jgi:hypothetical protein
MFKKLGKAVPKLNNEKLLDPESEEFKEAEAAKAAEEAKAEENDKAEEGDKAEAETKAVDEVNVDEEAPAADESDAVEETEAVDEQATDETVIADEAAAEIAVESEAAAAAIAALHVKEDEPMEKDSANSEKGKATGRFGFGRKKKAEAENSAATPTKEGEESVAPEISSTESLTTKTEDTPPNEETKNTPAVEDKVVAEASEVEAEAMAESTAVDRKEASTADTDAAVLSGTDSSAHAPVEGEEDGKKKGRFGFGRRKAMKKAPPDTAAAVAKAAEVAKETKKIGEADVDGAEEGGGEAEEGDTSGEMGGADGEKDAKKPKGRISMFGRHKDKDGNAHEKGAKKKKKTMFGGKGLFGGHKKEDEEKAKAEEEEERKKTEAKAVARAKREAKEKERAEAEAAAARELHRQLEENDLMAAEEQAQRDAVAAVLAAETAALAEWHFWVEITHEEARIACEPTIETAITAVATTPEGQQQALEQEQEAEQKLKLRQGGLDSPSRWKKIRTEVRKSLDLGPLERPRRGAQSIETSRRVLGVLFPEELYSHVRLRPLPTAKDKPDSSLYLCEAFQHPPTAHGLGASGADDADHSGATSSSEEDLSSSAGALNLRHEQPMLVRVDTEREIRREMKRMDDNIRLLSNCFPVFVRAAFNQGQAAMVLRLPENTTLDPSLRIFPAPQQVAMKALQSNPGRPAPCETPFTFAELVEEQQYEQRYELLPEQPKPPELIPQQGPMVSCVHPSIPQSRLLRYMPGMSPSVMDPIKHAIDETFGEALRCARLSSFKVDEANLYRLYSIEDMFRAQTVSVADVESKFAELEAGGKTIAAAGIDVAGVLAAAMEAEEAMGARMRKTRIGEEEAKYGARNEFNRKGGFIGYFREFLMQMGGYASSPGESHPNCLVHANLAADNLLLDSSGMVWLTDLSSTATGHGLKDIARLLVSVLLEGTTLEDEDELKIALNLTQVLLFDRLDLAEPLPSAAELGLPVPVPEPSESDSKTKGKLKKMKGKMKGGGRRQVLFGQGGQQTPSMPGQAGGDTSGEQDGSQEEEWKKRQEQERARQQRLRERKWAVVYHILQSIHPYLGRFASNYDTKGYRQSKDGIERSACFLGMAMLPHILRMVHPKADKTGAEQASGSRPDSAAPAADPRRRSSSVSEGGSEEESKAGGEKGSSVEGSGVSLGGEGLSMRERLMQKYAGEGRAADATALMHGADGRLLNRRWAIGMALQIAESVRRRLKITSSSTQLELPPLPQLVKAKGAEGRAGLMVPEVEDDGLNAEGMSAAKKKLLGGAYGKSKKKKQKKGPSLAEDEQESSRSPSELVDDRRVEVSIHRSAILKYYGAVRQEQSFIDVPFCGRPVPLLQCIPRVQVVSVEEVCLVADAALPSSPSSLDPTGFGSNGQVTNGHIVAGGSVPPWPLNFDHEIDRANRLLPGVRLSSVGTAHSPSTTLVAAAGAAAEAASGTGAGDAASAAAVNAAGGGPMARLMVEKMLSQANAHRHLVVVGGAGTGKTTLLRGVLLALADSALRVTAGVVPDKRKPKPKQIEAEVWTRPETPSSDRPDTAASIVTTASADSTAASDIPDADATTLIAAEKEASQEKKMAELQTAIAAKGRELGKLKGKVKALAKGNANGAKGGGEGAAAETPVPARAETEAVFAKSVSFGLPEGGSKATLEDVPVEPAADGAERTATVVKASTEGSDALVAAQDGDAGALEAAGAQTPAERALEVLESEDSVAEAAAAADAVAIALAELLALKAEYAALQKAHESHGDGAPDTLVVSTGEGGEDNRPVTPSKKQRRKPERAKTKVAQAESIAVEAMARHQELYPLDLPLVPLLVSVYELSRVAAMVAERERRQREVLREKRKQSRLAAEKANAERLALEEDAKRSATAAGVETDADGGSAEIAVSLSTVASDGADTSGTHNDSLSTPELFDEETDLLQIYLRRRFCPFSSRYAALTQARKEHRLVLLLDGLDEAGGTQIGHTIARYITEKLCEEGHPLVMVSSRPGVSWLDAIAVAGGSGGGGGHPNGSGGPGTELASSWAWSWLQVLAPSAAERHRIVEPLTVHASFTPLMPPVWRLEERYTPTYYDPSYYRDAIEAEASARARLLLNDTLTNSVGPYGEGSGTVPKSATGKKSSNEDAGEGVVGGGGGGSSDDGNMAACTTAPLQSTALQLLTLGGVLRPIAFDWAVKNVEGEMARLDAEAEARVELRRQAEEEAMQEQEEGAEAAEEQAKLDTAAAEEAAEAVAAEEAAAAEIEAAKEAKKAAEEEARDAKDKKKEELRSKMAFFYRRHKPDQLPNVDRLCVAKNEDEEKICAILRSAYGKDLWDGGAEGGNLNELTPITVEMAVAEDELLKQAAENEWSDEDVEKQCGIPHNNVAVVRKMAKEVLEASKLQDQEEFRKMMEVRAADKAEEVRGAAEKLANAAAEAERKSKEFAEEKARKEAEEEERKRRPMWSTVPSFVTEEEADAYVHDKGEEAVAKIRDGHFHVPSRHQLDHGAKEVDPDALPEWPKFTVETLMEAGARELLPLQPPAEEPKPKLDGGMFGAAAAEVEAKLKEEEEAKAKEEDEKAKEAAAAAEGDGDDGAEVVAAKEGEEKQDGEVEEEEKEEDPAQKLLREQQEQRQKQLLERCSGHGAHHTSGSIDADPDAPANYEEGWRFLCALAYWMQQRRLRWCSLPQMMEAEETINREASFWNNYKSQNQKKKRGAAAAAVAVAEEEEPDEAHKPIPISSLYHGSVLKADELGSSGEFVMGTSSTTRLMTSRSYDGGGALTEWVHEYKQLDEPEKTKDAENGGARKVRFMHPLWQEQLAALHLVAMMKKLSEELAVGRRGKQLGLISVKLFHDPPMEWWAAEMVDGEGNGPEAIARAANKKEEADRISGERDADAANAKAAAKEDAEKKEADEAKKQAEADAAIMPGGGLSR